MKSQRIQTFIDHYPFVGPSFWMVSVQYFIIQFVAAQSWMPRYSLSQNTISDLGNTVCGTFGERYVCSPLHALMNFSFIILGITMIAGSILIYHEFNATVGSAIGFSFMALAAIGTLLVGLFAENTILALHLLGAALPFLIGNIGMVVLGRSLDIPKALRTYTILSGTVSLVALALYVSHHYAGLGIGGMERVVAYPQTVWLIVFGIYTSRNHFKIRS